MTHLLDSLKINQERPECYIALGKIAMAVGTKIKPYVKNVLSMVNAGLTGGGAGKLLLLCSRVATRACVCLCVLVCGFSFVRVCVTSV